MRPQRWLGCPRRLPHTPDPAPRSLPHMQSWAPARAPQEPSLPGYSGKAEKGGIWLEDSGCPQAGVDAGDRERRYRTRGLMLQMQTLRREAHSQVPT